MDKKGFFGALFDFSFSEFITTKIIKFLYILSLIGIAIGALFMLVQGFRGGFASGLLALIIGVPLYLLIANIIKRVWLEILIVLFRLYDNVKSINDKTK